MSKEIQEVSGSFLMRLTSISFLRLAPVTLSREAVGSALRLLLRHAGPHPSPPQSGQSSEDPELRGRRPNSSHLPIVFAGWPWPASLPFPHEGVELCSPIDAFLQKLYDPMKVSKHFSFQSWLLFKIPLVHRCCEKKSGGQTATISRLGK